MSEKPKAPAPEMPPLADLKGIGYDIFMEIAGLNAKLQDAQRRLNTVNKDIRDYPATIVNKE